MAPKYILSSFLQQELLINITEHEVGEGLGWDETETQPPALTFLGTADVRGPPSVERR